MAVAKIKTSLERGRMHRTERVRTKKVVPEETLLPMKTLKTMTMKTIMDRVKNTRTWETGSILK